MTISEAFDVAQASPDLDILKLIAKGLDEHNNPAYATLIEPAGVLINPVITQIIFSAIFHAGMIFGAARSPRRIH